MSTKDNGIGGTDAPRSKIVGIAGDMPWMKPKANLSFIEDHEQDEAQTLIDKQFVDLTGKTFREHARLTRYFCAVKIYVRPEEIKVGPNGEHSIIMPDMVRAEDRYQSCVGLVISLGPQAFQDKDGNPRGSSYRVGDWVAFSRTDIIRIDFKSVALGVMTDDRVIMVVDDPTDWTIGSLTFKA